MTQQSPKLSRNSNPALEGRILKVTRNTEGLARVTLDNGLTGTITILSRNDQLPDLLDADLAAIREHLVTRKPGRLRVKRKR